MYEYMLAVAAKGLIEKFFGKLLEDTVGYWKIYDYTKFKVKQIWEDKITIWDENHFWYSILSDRFAGEKPQDCFEPKSGQLVQFKDMFLSEWAPKLPGQLWTIEGAKRVIEGLKKVDKCMMFSDKLIDVLDMDGKEKLVSAGYGSVRTNPEIGNDDYFAYMSLVSARNWNCDHGIPIVVSKSVYEQFKKHSRCDSSPEIDGEGILFLEQGLPFSRIIPTAIGATLSKELEDTLRFRPFLPKCYIYVSSPLSVKMRFHDKAPDCVAWTMFETQYVKRYGFTYKGFSPTQKDSIVAAVDFIHWYVENYGGKAIITDFDGIEPKLEAKVNLVSDPMSAKVRDLREILLNLEKWIGTQLKGWADKYSRRLGRDFEVSGE